MLFCVVAVGVCCCSLCWGVFAVVFGVWCVIVVVGCCLLLFVAVVPVCGCSS